MRYTISESSGAAFRRWTGQTPTPEMRALMDAVAAELARGVFYSRELHAAILKRYDFTPEELAREVGRVEGGVVGMEIYYARRAVDAEATARDEAKAREELKPAPGLKLPPLRFSQDGLRLVRGAVVCAVGAGGVVFEFKRGGGRATVTTTARAILRAIHSAKERAAC